MKHYVPFLKMKQNEIGAICELKKDIRDGITPFFDIPRPKENTLAEIAERLRIAKKQADMNLSGVTFYLDNFDIDDTISLDGRYQYETILDLFSAHHIIPVVGLNRDPRHNMAAIEFSNRTNKKIVLRLTAQDIESYRISKFEIDSIYSELSKQNIDYVDVVFDFRVITTDPAVLGASALKFLTYLEADHFANKIIIAGSSIPASVRDLLKTKEYTHIVRRECWLWEYIKKNNTLSGRNLVFGDYGLVSPDYTDMELDFAMIQNIAAPKAFYTFQDSYFLVRGGAFKTHPDKYGQYFSIADLIVGQKFFRPYTYSYGEKYIIDRCAKAKIKLKKAGSPGSWLKATLTTHITFIYNSL